MRARCSHLYWFTVPGLEVILKDKCDLKDSKKGHQEQGLDPGRDTYGTCHRGGQEEITSDRQERRVILLRVSKSD